MRGTRFAVPKVSRCWRACCLLANDDSKGRSRALPRREHVTGLAIASGRMNAASSGGRRREGGVADEHSPVALLLIDMVNALEFEGSQPLVRRAPPAAQRLSVLRARASRAKV